MILNVGAAVGEDVEGAMVVVVVLVVDVVVVVVVVDGMLDVVDIGDVSNVVGAVGNIGDGVVVGLGSVGDPTISRSNVDVLTHLENDHVQSFRFVSQPYLLREHLHGDVWSDSIQFDVNDAWIISAGYFYFFITIINYL